MDGLSPRRMAINNVNIFCWIIILMALHSYSMYVYIDGVGRVPKCLAEFHKQILLVLGVGVKMGSEGNYQSIVNGHDVVQGWVLAIEKHISRRLQSNPNAVEEPSPIPKRTFNYTFPRMPSVGAVVMAGLAQFEYNCQCTNIRFSSSTI